MAECGQQLAVLGTCTDCTHEHEHFKRCRDRHVCATCAKDAGRKTYARSIPAVERMVKQAFREWHARGRFEATRPVVRLLTLTVRHSGDLVHDRKVLEKGWVRHRAWLAKTWNPRKTPHRTRMRFVRVWECTNGHDGLGHVHFHAVTVAPRYSYKAARAAWIGHTDGASTQYDVTSIPKDNAKQAAQYLAKYVSKGSAGLDGETAAAWWVASYARRALSTHRGCWLEKEPPHCQECGSLLLEWVLAKGQAGAREREATGPPLPWASSADFAEYALADIL